MATRCLTPVACYVKVPLNTPPLVFSAAIHLSLPSLRSRKNTILCPSSLSSTLQRSASLAHLFCATPSNCGTPLQPRFLTTQIPVAAYHRMPRWQSLRYFFVSGNGKHRDNEGKGGTTESQTQAAHKGEGGVADEQGTNPKQRLFSLPKLARTISGSFLGIICA